MARAGRVAEMPLRFAFEEAATRPQSRATLVNCYAESSPGKGRAVILGTPGARTIEILPSPVRGMLELNDVLYVTAGDGLYRMRPGGMFTRLGTITGSGPVDMVANRFQVAVCARPEVFVWDLGREVLEAMSAKVEEFPGARSITMVKSFPVFVHENGDRFGVCGIDDWLNYDAVDFATAEARPDGLVAARSISGELILLGQTTTELWGSTGAANFPFASAGVSNIGCAAAATAQAFDGGVMFLGRDGDSGGFAVYQSRGLAVQRASTHAVDRLIERAANPANATAYSYRHEGHLFYVLGLDSGTAVFGGATSSWHQAATGSWPWGADPGPSGYTASAFAWGKTYLGDSTGRIALMGGTDDDGGPVLRVLRSAPMGAQMRNAVALAVELEIETGTGTNTAPAYVELAVSRDGGRTQDKPRAASIGRLGNYRTVARWNMLGMARDFEFEFRFSGSGPFRVTGGKVQYQTTDAV